MTTALPPEGPRAMTGSPARDASGRIESVGADSSRQAEGRPREAFHQIIGPRPAQ